MQRGSSTFSSDLKPEAIRQSSGSFLDQARTSLIQLIGEMDTSRIRGSKCSPIAEKDRIAVGSDLHGLFCDEQAFAQFCADPAPTAIIAGDILDFLSINRFRTNIDYVTCREELADGRARLELLSKSFNRVYFVDGNHDKRALRRIQDIAPQLLPLIISPLDLLAQGLENVHRLSTEIKNSAPRSDYGQNHVMDYCGMVGDILVGHFDNFCGPDAAVAVDKWVEEWGTWMNLPTKPRVILQAHNHRLNSAYTSGGRLLISTGCLCKPMPYQIDGHGKYRPPTVGYVVLYQKNGVTDQSRTQLVYVGGNN